MIKKRTLLFVSIIFLSGNIFYPKVFASDEFSEFEQSASTNGSDNLNLNGFLLFEQGRNISRVGLQKDSNRDYVLANRILRLQTTKVIDNATLNFKLDLKNDDITQKSIVDIRQAKINIPLSKSIDLSFGRQISTWGVGDFIFINDLFPKDWIAHFTGQESEYIKNPSNSIRLTKYFSNWNIDFIYQPQFTPDHTPSGCRFSVFDPNKGLLNIFSNTCSTKTVTGRERGAFDDGEIALSIKTKIENHEVAIYGYKGFYKSPKGLQLSGSTYQGIYPRLNEIGLSDEGQLASGIFSFETGYYRSVDDLKGDNYLIENSMLKYLIGYRMDLSSVFSFGLQFYQEKMLNYNQYQSSFLSANSANYQYRKKEYQSTYTLRLTYKAQQETLWFSFFSYLRPDDHDSFSKFEIKKRISDNFEVTTGVNIFTGKKHYLDREFGMLKNDDNAFFRLKIIF